MEKYIITINAETAEELQKALADLSRTFNFNEMFTYKEATKAVDEPTETIAQEEPATSPTEETFKDVAKTIELSDIRAALASAAHANPEIKSKITDILANYGFKKVSEAEGNQEALLELMGLAESVKNG